MLLLKTEDGCRVVEGMKHSEATELFLAFDEDGDGGITEPLVLAGTYRFPTFVRVLGFGSWVLGFGFWVLGFGFWVLGFGLWALGFGFWVLCTCASPLPSPPLT